MKSSHILLTLMIIQKVDALTPPKKPSCPIKKTTAHKNDNDFTVLSQKTFAAIERILQTMKQENRSLNQNDYRALITNLTALMLPKPRMTGIRFMTTEASELYNISKKAYYTLRNNTGAESENNLTQAILLIKAIKEMIEKHHSQ